MNRKNPETTGVIVGAVIIGLACLGIFIPLLAEAQLIPLRIRLKTISVFRKKHE
jgi:hypothetical protein